MRRQSLTPHQIDHFLDHGYVIVEECFSQQVAQEWTVAAFSRLGYDAGDPATWKEARVHMRPTARHVDVEKFAPRAYGAVCDLVGGAARAVLPLIWGDTFVVNLREGADRPYEEPSAAVKGWHKDGYYFRHFLDSGDQGLLMIVAWTDILPRGGGTFIACDSVGVVARYLLEHPEGVEPGAFGALIGQCRQFMEITARAGDVVLLHPFMLHAVSQNVRGVPRLITNPPVMLRQPLNFNRGDPGDHSPVERAVLRGLRMDRLDFKITAPRQGTLPQWVLEAQEFHRAKEPICD